MHKDKGVECQGLGMNDNTDDGLQRDSVLRKDEWEDDSKGLVRIGMTNTCILSL